jgi:hypothetical protein
VSGEREREEREPVVLSVVNASLLIGHCVRRGAMPAVTLGCILMALTTRSKIASSSARGLVSSSRGALTILRGCTLSLGPQKGMRTILSTWCSV